MQNPITDPDDKLWMLLGQTRRQITRVRQRELQPYQITARVAAILIIIEAIGDSATPTSIAQHLLLEKHTVSEALKRMEQQGLLKKKGDSKSKNRLKISLTERGLQAYEQSIRMEPIHRLMSSLSKEERRQLWDILLKLRSSALDTLRELTSIDEWAFTPRLEESGT